MNIQGLAPYIPLIIGGIMMILFGYGLFSKPRPPHSKHSDCKEDTRKNKKGICECNMPSPTEIATNNKTQPCKRPPSYMAKIRKNDSPNKNSEGL